MVKLQSDGPFYKMIIYTIYASNEKQNAAQENGYKQHQKEALFAKVEALYLLKSKLLERDQ
eukprot:14712132-Ditylum_brightwellii.AAC.1